MLTHLWQDFWSIFTIKLIFFPTKSKYFDSNQPKNFVFSYRNILKLKKNIFFGQKSVLTIISKYHENYWTIHLALNEIWELEKFVLSLNRNFRIYASSYFYWQTPTRVQSWKSSGSKNCWWLKKGIFTNLYKTFLGKVCK